MRVGTLSQLAVLLCLLAVSLMPVATFTPTPPPASGSLVVLEMFSNVSEPGIFLLDVHGFCPVAYLLRVPSLDVFDRGGLAYLWLGLDSLLVTPRAGVEIEFRGFPFMFSASIPYPTPSDPFHGLAFETTFRTSRFESGSFTLDYRIDPEGDAVLIYEQGARAVSDTLEPFVLGAGVCL